MSLIENSLSLICKININSNFKDKSKEILRLFQIIVKIIAILIFIII